MFKIRNSSKGNEMKFISVKSYGLNPNIVNEPRIKGNKNKAKNFLLSNIFKINIL